MNNKRRKNVNAIISQLETLKEEIESLREEEQEYMDNMPEGLQESERYRSAEQTVSDFEDAETNIIDAIETLENCKNN